MLYNNELPFETTGRRSVTARLETLYGQVEIVKAQHCIKASIQGFVGRIMNPEQLRTIFGEVIYDTWAGQPNGISQPAQLINIEINKATVYLIFQPLS